MDAQVRDATAPEVARVGYVPTGSLAMLLLKNLGLSIITFGIYRFWAMTALRRYFWGSIRIADEPLEYTGRGIELFIGFLIVLVVFVAPAGLLGLIKMLALIDQTMLAIVQSAYALLILLLVQIAQFRARRYRLSRTLWRGIRCGQDGSTVRFVALAVCWNLFEAVTLGIGAPWTHVALERYRLGHTLFGDRRLTFDGSGLHLLLRWLGVYAAIIASAALILSLGYYDQARAIVVALHAKQPFPRTFNVLTLSPLLVFVAWGLAYVWYRIAEFRYFASCTRLGEMRLRSNAQWWRVMLWLIAFLGTLILTVAIVSALVVGVSGMVVVAAGWQASADKQTLGFVIIVATGFIVYLLSYLLGYLLLRAPILRHLCQTLEIVNITAVDAVAQSAAAPPRFGEGLADSFDFGVS